MGISHIALASRACFSCGVKRNECKDLVSLSYTFEEKFYSTPWCTLAVVIKIGCDGWKELELPVTTRSSLSLWCKIPAITFFFRLHMLSFVHGMNCERSEWEFAISSELFRSCYAFCSRARLDDWLAAGMRRLRNYCIKSKIGNFLRTLLLLACTRRFFIRFQKITFMRTSLAKE